MLLTNDDRRAGWVTDQAALVELGLDVVHALHGHAENLGAHRHPNRYVRRVVRRARLQTVQRRASDARLIARSHPWHHCGARCPFDQARP